MPSPRWCRSPGQQDCPSGSETGATTRADSDRRWHPHRPRPLEPDHGRPGRRIALAQPGLTWGDYVARALEYGLATPSGDTAQAGLCGQTPGGGVGMLSRRYGLTTDGVQKIAIVTRDAGRITANAAEHHDLFWVMRGGVGSYGVVTSLRLHPAVEAFPFAR